HEMRAVRFDDVVDPADVRMRDLAPEAHLVMEPLEIGRVALAARREKLQRDGLAELRVVRAIDLAHAALAEDRGDAIAAGDDGAGRELRFVLRGAGCERYVAVPSFG